MKTFSERVAKYVNISWRNLAIPKVTSPPFLILVINSLCNMKCEHCFYWQQLNQRDDLSLEEIVSLCLDESTKAWTLEPDGSWRSPGPSQRVDAQRELQTRALHRGSSGSEGALG